MAQIGCPGVQLYWAQMAYPIPMHTRRSRNGLIRRFIIAVVLCIAICGVSRSRAPAEASFSSLIIHNNDGSLVQYQTYPEARAKILFPSAEAWLDGEQNTDTWGLPSPFLKKIRLLRLSDMKHRFTIVGASFGERLFIFDELFCSENAAVMNEVISATHSSPRDDAEALGLAKLYLSLSYYQLDDPAKFVAVRGSNPRPKDDSGSPRSFSDAMGVSHSPQVSHKDGVYSVDMFAYSKLGATGGPVTHWRIELADSRFNEQMAEQHRTQPVPPKDATQKNGGEKRINFTVDLMGDGRSADGAKIDLQLWSASDGPGISRNHYYYPSHEKAETRMQDFLQNAVAVLDSGPWNNAAGKQALVLQANEEKKSLFASQLYEDESSVLELSCSCLRNLLAAQSGGHTRTIH
jgi:hypothetical protein